MAHIDIVLWCFHSYSTRTIGISNIHLPYHPKIWPKDRHSSLHIQINIPGMDVKGILWTSQRKPPQQSCKMVGLDTQQQRGITTLPIHQRGLKQHSRLDIYVISHIRLIFHLDFHIPPPTTDRCIVPHQNSIQRYYLLDIVSIIILDTTKWISKATAVNNSVNLG